MVPRRFKTARVPLAAVVLSTLAAAFLPGACSKVPLVAPSGTAITLIATSNVLPINGSTDIVAVLIENGQTSSGDGTGTPAATSTSSGTPVHDGTLVSFTTSLGKIEPSEAKTSGGQVTVKLISDGKSGIAKITAYSGGASKTLDVTVGSAAAVRILLSASPQALPSKGGTTTITANVQDQQGNPVPGVPVTFTATAGTLGQSTVVSDPGGNATTTLATTANVTVAATAGGGTTGTLTATLPITIAPKADLAVTVPQNIVASAPANFSVVVAATVPATNVELDFGDGDSAPLGALSGTQAVQHLYARGNRTYDVTLTGTFNDGTTVERHTQVVVADWDVLTMSCSAPPPGGGASTLSATVTANTLISDYVWTIDDNGSQVRHGASVAYAWQSPGNHFVTLDVVPAAGQSKRRTCSVVVP